MNTALDVAAYIIKLSTDIGEPITNMKLQKLLYYSYAWFMVETKGEKLFDEPILAWQYGPIVLSAYEAYKSYGAEPIKKVVGERVDELNKFSKEIVEDVFNIYGDKSAIELMQLSHLESPWRDTYEEGNSSKAIDEKLIFEFYKAKKEQTKD